MEIFIQRKFLGVIYEFHDQKTSSGHSGKKETFSTLGNSGRYTPDDEIEFDEMGVDNRGDVY
ncbi:hypothetical protein THII_0607 [Thioploca ingrica]|uniref:Uncharacterized protein n=1 Tax=Thioploca ingrica TaxID=40754 RepID=A0A090ADL3_9GAMM|nr:hypothetical protein THII_0607 [Thioploca ingrica]